MIVYLFNALVFVTACAISGREKVIWADRRIVTSCGVEPIIKVLVMGSLIRIVAQICGHVEVNTLKVLEVTEKTRVSYSI